ncbi:MAG: Asp-tRNA(Asn)/Glu-tRNA(Gln) amidotransferase subunit GatA [Clostridia bacterium]|nr:Asp-tRNA(Asn)/Glu-tRNA(Gln) amidotransferase subunit GatA [Clostridia bacterium]
MNILGLSAIEIAEKIAAKELTAVEVTRAYLDVISQTDDAINAWLYVDDAYALNNAEKVQKEIDSLLSQGKKLPALAGVPVGIKDNMCVNSVKTTCASKILYNFVPPYDATAIKNAQKNLMVILGKTNMDEFAMGSSTEHSAFKQTKNPWNTRCVPGGSSGGSAAAVAALQAPLALGSDTGGSIRQPAAFCGVTGLKPTYGTVSRYGLVAFASSLDQIGPFAKDAAGCAALFDAIKGHDEKDSTSYKMEYESSYEEIDNFKKPTIGILTEYMGEGVTNDIKQAVIDAKAKYESLGCDVIEISIPVLTLALPAYYILSSAEASSNLSRFDGVRYGYRSEGADDLQDLYIRSRSEGFGTEVKRRIMLGTFTLCSGYYDEYYNKALKARSLVVKGYEDAFSKVDILLCPATPTTAFKIGEKTDDAMSMYLADLCTVSVNIAGLPAISFPGGFDESGLPIGLQLIGSKFSESLLLSTVNAFQNETNYHKACPAEKGGAK